MADQTTASPQREGAIAGIFRTVLPDVEFEVAETISDTALTIDRTDLERVMEAARDDERLAFDYLRCVSGVDQIATLESVYHLYSFKWGHTAAIKVRCTLDDPHIPTVSHLWQTANWLERETAELFGIVYDGHPDPRPLLTEEGMGYYILRKSHPLAPIEEWQEDFLREVQDAQAKAAQAAGPAAPTGPVDERALKIQQAQQKAAIMKKAREEARAKGLSGAEEKEAVTAAIRAWEEEQAATASAAPAAAAAPAAPATDTASKIKQAQAKAAIMKKAREDARAKGLSPEDEKAAVRAALDELAASQAAAAPAATPAPAAPPAAAPVMDRAAKIALAQKKAAAIKGAREQARMQGLGPEEERKMVQEALQKVAEEG